jgi:hypothetical protein
LIEWFIEPGKHNFNIFGNDVLTNLGLFALAVPSVVKDEILSLVDEGHAFHEAEGVGHVGGVAVGVDNRVVVLVFAVAGGQFHIGN